MITPPTTLPVAARGNRTGSSDDLSYVQCDQWREALSAQADGEDPGVDGRLLIAHLAHCVSCRSFSAEIEGAKRRSTVRIAPSVPDLSKRVARAAAVLDRASKWSIVRVLLIAVAVQIVVLSAPALVLGKGQEQAHDARHLGAFAIAYAVALLVAAVRPARARTVLPVAAVLAGALFVTAVVDLSTGSVPLVNEAAHIPELLSVLLVWLLAMPSRRQPADAGSVESPTALRLVREDRSDRDAM